MQKKGCLDCPKHPSQIMNQKVVYISVFAKSIVHNELCINFL